MKFDDECLILMIVLWLVNVIFFYLVMGKDKVE